MRTLFTFTTGEGMGIPLINLCNPHADDDAYVSFQVAGYPPPEVPADVPIRIEALDSFGGRAAIEAGPPERIDWGEGWYKARKQSESRAFPPDHPIQDFLDD